MCCENYCKQSGIMLVAQSIDGTCQQGVEAELMIIVGPKAFVSELSSSF